MTDVSLLALAVELEGSFSFGAKIRNGYIRRVPVIRLEQAVYGDSPGLLEALQAHWKGSIGHIQRDGRPTYLRYWSVASREAINVAVAALPHLSIKKPQARVFLIHEAASRQRPTPRARVSPARKTFDSVLSHVNALLNSVNVDRRRNPARVARFLHLFAPDYAWLEEPVFSNVIDQHVEQGMPFQFPMPDLEKHWSSLSTVLQDLYLWLHVDPNTRWPEKLVREVVLRDEAQQGATLQT